MPAPDAGRAVSHPFELLLSLEAASGFEPEYGALQAPA